MARTKSHRNPTKKSGVKSHPNTQRENVASTSGSSSRLNRYLVLNGIFWAFCIIQLFLVRFVLPDFAGIYFFFGFLMISFSIVSLIDYLSEYVGIGDEPQETDFHRYEQD